MENKFLWGCSTSAAQIEGAYLEDGKSLSIWDNFSAQKMISDGCTCFDACDSYHKFKEDIALLKELGVNAYRFSFAWTRVCPDKTMKVNDKGIEYYHALIDECLKNGITPVATMYHWDAPLWLYESDMWLSGEILKYFPLYVETLLKAFSKKIKHWIVINEPECVSTGVGGNFPDKEYTPKERLQIVHNILLAQGMGGKLVKKYGCLLGSSINGTYHYPISDDAVDVEAARLAFFDLERGDTFSTSIFADPMFLGKYPDVYFQKNEKDILPEITNEDMKIIKCDFDFLGFNPYSGVPIKAANNEKGYEILPPESRFRTAIGWTVNPKIMYYAPKFLYERYHLPIMVTENGCSFLPNEEHRRIEFLSLYLSYLDKAIMDGIPVIGYFHWSLIDNFEWFGGYRHFFGLVDINRNKKEAFFYYRDYIKKHQY